MIPVILRELKPPGFNELEARDVQVVAGDPLQEFSKQRAFDTSSLLHLTRQVFSKCSIDFLKLDVPLLFKCLLLPTILLILGVKLNSSFWLENPFRVSGILNAELNELALRQARAIRM